MAEASGGVTCGPHELEQVLDGDDPFSGEGFEELIMNVVRPRLGPVRELPDT